MTEDSLEKVHSVDSLIADYARKNPEEERSKWFSLKGFFVATKLKLKAKYQAAKESVSYDKKLAEMIDHIVKTHPNIFDLEISGKVLRWFHHATLSHLDTKNEKIRHVIQEAIFHSHDVDKQQSLACLLGQNSKK